MTITQNASADLLRHTVSFVHIHVLGGGVSRGERFDHPESSICCPFWAWDASQVEKPPGDRAKYGEQNAEKK